MTYTEALDYIHGVSWTFCKPGLDRITELCASLGNPQDSLKFVHVAGTNGKGSFSSMLSSILCESGLKVGLFTSPYILEFNERMRINGENIPNDTLAKITARIKPIADAMKDKPTEFELITAIALEYFKDEAVDLVVFECGLGGRLDSTNVIKTPLLSVITGIALDHVAFLGDTVEKIALEKAGIIKHGIPVLYGGEDELAASVIKSEAEKKNAPFSRTNYSELHIRSKKLSGTEFDYCEWHNMRIKLLGMYQPKNASLVLDAVDILKPAIPSITEDAVRKGLAKASWRARFEIISDDPMLIFDGAHNAQGINAAVESIKEYFNEEKVVAISGVLKDKDYREIAGKISEVCDIAFTITPENPRALSAKEYADELKANGVFATPTDCVKDALTQAIALAKSDTRRIVCLGSLYTYCEILPELEAIKKA